MTRLNGFSELLIGFVRFLLMQVFGTLRLLMGLLGPDWPLLGRSGPKWILKMFPKVVQKIPKNWYTK